MAHGITPVIAQTCAVGPGGGGWKLMAIAMVLDAERWLVLFTFHNGLRIANGVRKNEERQSIIISNETVFAFVALRCEECPTSPPRWHPN